MISLGGLVSQKAFGKFEMGKVISNPFATAFIKEGEGEDHEVSMANNSIDIIIKMATELKAKMGEDEKQIPAWIQDHIAKAENLISQASGNYHEYGDSNESVNEAPNKLKHTISKKEWSKIPKYNKHIGMDGVHYIMKYDDKIGTYLQGVQIVDESVNEDKGPCWKGYKQVGMKDKGGRQVPNCVPNESVVNEDINAFETLMLIRNLEQTNKLLVQDLKTSKGLSNNKKENIKKSIAINQGLINHYKEILKNLKNNESVVNEEPVKSTGEKIQNLNNRIKALKDKMAATKSSEQKNLIQQRLKNALQTLSNYKKQNISKEGVVKEISGRTPKIFVKTAAVEKKIKELMADRKKAVVPYNSETDPAKKEKLKQILIKLTNQIKGYEKNLVQLRDMEEAYLQQMHADAELDTTGL